jgi:hypothetical protein
MWPRWGLLTVVLFTLADNSQAQPQPVESSPSLAILGSDFTSQPEREEKPSLVEWFAERDRRRMTPELDRWAAQIADLDRADPAFDWSALRRIKQNYTIFQPTPGPLRREFITDRPDKTINPVTVDAGTVQLETDLVTATFDRRQPRQLSAPGQKPRTGTGGFVRQQPFTPGDKDDYVFLLTNIRIGWTNNIESQVFLRPFQQLITPAVGGLAPIDRFGFGDIRVLLKENLWGNEGGPTAFSLVQYLDIPAGQSDLSTGVLEGGTTGAFLIRLPGKTYIGLESGLEWRQDIAEDRYHLEVPASASLGYAFTKELSAKAEFASVFSAEPGAQWVGVISLGVLYGGADDIQVDAGINIGVTPAANDWNPFLGLSKRF